MPISDAQYQAWLAADNKERVVLAEVQAYSGGSVVTRYMSNRGFTSSPSDTPPNVAYEDILLEVPRIRSATAEVFRGKSLVSFGDLEIDNSSGVRDSWLLDAWDGRPVSLYLGDPSWPKTDFRQVYAGTIEDISANGNRRLNLRIRDRQHLMEVPLQTNRVGGTGPAKDQRIPLAYGEVKMVEPVLIDAATRTYQWNDGSVQSVDAVYQDGIAIGTYTANNAAGTISLTAAATGRITLDGKGSNAGGYVDKLADIAKRIIDTRSTAGTVLASSVTQLNIDAPGVVGVYYADDSETVLSALDDLLARAGCYFYINRTGEIVLAQFKVPSGTPVVSLIDDDIELASLDLAKRINPLKSIRVGYAQFHTTIDSGAATGLTEAQRARLKDEFLVSFASTGATGFLLALDDDIRGTPYINSSDAATEASRLATLWGSLRRVFRFRAFLAAQQVTLGDVISLDFARYGLSGGVLVRVIGINESITSNRVELEVFL